MAPLLSRLGASSFGFGKKIGAPKSIVQTVYSFTGTWVFGGPTVATTNTVSVPASTTSVTIKCLGGGTDGAWGGKSQATFTNLVGKTLTARIGGYGEGAYVSIFGSPYGNGFHYAGVFDGPVSQANALVVGGGSGAAAGNQQDGTTGNNITPGPSGVNNGGGGNQGGNNGSKGWRNDFVSPPTAPGRGATTTAGGAGGSGHNGGESGFPGSALQGGTGGRSLPSPGFDLGSYGGGGGYWGGGGGGGGWNGPGQPAATPLTVPSGGGGGSGYIHPTGTATIGDVGSVEANSAPGSITITVTEFK
jgi:hypothetical protein